MCSGVGCHGGRGPVTGPLGCARVMRELVPRDFGTDLKWTVQAGGGGLGLRRGGPACDSDLMRKTTPPPLAKETAVASVLEGDASRGVTCAGIAARRGCSAHLLVAHV